MQGSVDDPEDKAIPQLAITYGVLRRLGFEEDIVERCLKSIWGIDLEQAVEWVRNGHGMLIAHQYANHFALALHSLHRGRASIRLRYLSC